MDKTGKTAFFSNKVLLSDELKFLNQLKSLLAKDEDFKGPEGLHKKAEHLYAAMELVLNSGNNLSNKDKAIIEKEMNQLKKVVSQEPKEAQKDIVELEGYLGGVAQKTGDRKLVEKCHALRIQVELGSSTSVPKPS